MRRATDTIELDWCPDHDVWYCRDCPDCLVNSVSDDLTKEYEQKISVLEGKIAGLEDNILELKEGIK